MAQVGIREYDAKAMFSKYTNTKYSWIKVTKVSDIKKLDDNKKYVIKPDKLFWKRWKLWLIWVNLDKREVKKWLEKNIQKEIEISGIKWILDVFLVEEFVPHNEEYYISFEWKRDWDYINFSEVWWIDVEENWEKVKTIKVNVLKELTDSDLNNLWIKSKKVKEIITSLFTYFRAYHFTYLEVNPFCFNKNNWELVLIDMVWKIDDSAHYLMKWKWDNLEIPTAWWFKESKSEKYIRELDEKTGASLKLKILNPEGKIWTLLAWWWWSLVFTDTLSHLWFTQEIATYWELSWDPDKYNTREYTKTLLNEMLSNWKIWKYLIIWWAIANFTKIDKTFSWIIDVLEEKKSDLLDQKVKILVRRWWINDKKWLKMIEKACKNMWIPIKIADSNDYMTNILNEINI